MKTLDLSQVHTAAGGAPYGSWIIYGEDYARRMGLL